MTVYEDVLCCLYMLQSSFLCVVQCSTVCCMTVDRECSVLLIIFVWCVLAFYSKVSTECFSLYQGVFKSYCWLLAIGWFLMWGAHVVFKTWSCWSDQLEESRLICPFSISVWLSAGVFIFSGVLAKIFNRRNWNHSLCHLIASPGHRSPQRRCLYPRDHKVQRRLGLPVLWGGFLLPLTGQWCNAFFRVWWLLEGSLLLLWSDWSVRDWDSCCCGGEWWKLLKLWLNFNCETVSEGFLAGGGYVGPPWGSLGVSFL